jgi:hypothetical protein
MARGDTKQAHRLLKAAARHDKPIVSSSACAASAKAPAAVEKLPMKAFAAEAAPPRGFRQSDLQAFFREVGGGRL